MAGLGSAFGGSFEESIDNSRARRSKNMEAFNSFVKMQKELGVDARPEDLERMKRGLAGGSTYFTQGLPSDFVLNATSQRLGAIKADKEVVEQSNVIANETATLGNKNTSQQMAKRAQEMLITDLGLLVGTNAADDTTWADLKAKNPVVIQSNKIYGEEATRQRLIIGDQDEVTRLIAERKWSNLTDQAAQQSIIQGAAPYQVKGLQAHFKTINTKYKTNSQRVARDAALGKLGDVFNGATNRGAAVKELMLIADNAMPIDLKIDGQQRINLESQFEIAFDNYMNDFTSAAITEAGVYTDTSIVGKSDEIENVAKKLLAEAGVMAPSADQINRVKEALVANVTGQLRNEVDQKLAAIQTKIDQRLLEELEELEVNTKEFDAEVDALMSASNIDFTTPDYQDASGNKTQKYNDDKAKIEQTLINRINYANSKELTRETKVFRDSVTTSLKDGILSGFLGPDLGDRQKSVFIELNNLRRTAGIPEYSVARNSNGDYTDPEFRKQYKVFQGAMKKTISEAHTAALNTERQLAEDALKAAIDYQSSVLSKLAEENTMEYIALSQLDSMFIVDEDRFAKVRREIEAQLSQHEVTDWSTQGLLVMDVVKRVGADNNLLPKSAGATWKNRRVVSGMASRNLVKPGTYVGDWLTDIADMNTQAADVTISTINNLPLDATATQLKTAAANRTTAIRLLQELKADAIAERMTEEMQAVLDHRKGTGGTAELAFTKAIDAKITELQSAAPSNIPTFITALSAGGFKVNPNAKNVGASVPMGFVLGATYELDPTSTNPPGFKLTKGPPVIPASPTLDGVAVDNSAASNDLQEAVAYFSDVDPAKSPSALGNAVSFLMTPKDRMNTGNHEFPELLPDGLSLGARGLAYFTETESDERNALLARTQQVLDFYSDDGSKTAARFLNKFPQLKKIAEDNPMQFYQLYIYHQTQQTNMP